MKRTIIYLCFILCSALGSLHGQNSMDTPYDLGSFSIPGGNFSHTVDTHNFTEDYGDHITNDAYYRFTLSTPMDVTISHCGSELEDTYLYLLNSFGNAIAY